MRKRPGWMPEPEREAIRRSAKGRGDALEIGAYCGLSTEVLLDATYGQVFSVDPFERGQTVPVHAQQRSWILDLAQKYPSRLVVIPARSDELIWTRPIDVLPADGSYGRQGCATS